MNTAESLIKEYLDRGCSLEALRLVAESRPHPLCGEMLSIIEAMEAEAEPVACETGAFAPASGDMVFFVADDDESMSGEGAIDFDVMAATSGVPAAEMAAPEEESVADIMVEEAERGEVAESALSTASEEPAQSGSSEMGIWSRFWSRMRVGETPSLKPAPKKLKQKTEAFIQEYFKNEAGVEKPALEAEPVAEAPPESSGPEAALMPEAEVPGHSAVEMESFEIAAQGDVSADYIPGTLSEMYETPDSLRQEMEIDKARLLEAQIAISAGAMAESAVGECDAAIGTEAPAAEEAVAAGDALVAEESASGESGEPVDVAEEPLTDGLEEPVFEEPVADEPAMTEEPVAEEINSEKPCVVEPVDEAVAAEGPVAEESANDILAKDDAVAGDDAVREPVAEEFVAEEPVAEAVLPVEPPASEPLLAGQPENASGKKTSRRERRRRERAQKKKEKRAKKDSTALELPEIVLTRSEDTETMMPETGADASEIESANRDASAIACLSAPATEDVAEMADGDAEEKEAPEMGAAMSLITPADILEDAAVEAPAAEEASTDAAEMDVMETPEECVENAEDFLPVDSAAENPEEMASVDESTPECASEVDEGEIQSARGFDEDGAMPEADLDGVVDAGETAAPVGEDAFVAEDNREEYAGSDDHLMIIAGGGYDLDEVERLFLSYEVGDESFAEEMDVPAEAATNNVILFHERFPVFAGEQLDAEDFEEEDEGSFHPVLRVLPLVEMGEAVGEEPEAALEEQDAVGEPLTEAAAEASEEPAPEEQPIESEPAAMEDVAEAVEEVEDGGETPPVAESAPDLPAGEAAEEAAAPIGDVLTPAARLCLLRAFSGGPMEEASAIGEPADLFEDEHLIVSLEPEKDTAAEMLEREAAVRAEMEVEYQARLDEFAGRILQVQAATAASEARVREKTVELEARDTIIAEVQDRLAAAEKKQQATSRSLDEARRDIGARQAEIERLKGVQEEHGRLYAEFEDLRKAYNEVVTEVMPELQDERDDLAMTVERQCQKEKKLRGTLASSRRRLAVGYALGAAACVMFVALPVVNWLKADGDVRDLAVDHQKMSELRENYENAQKSLIDKDKAIFELRGQLASAQGQSQNQNREMARSTQREQQNVAVFPPPPSSQRGTPTRTSTMALQATDQPSGRLRVNQVRDPAGSIESLMAHNQNNNTAPNAPRMAQSESRQRIPVSSIASRERPGEGSGNGLRPGAAANTTRPPQAQQPRQVAGARATRGQPQTARRDEVVAKVKKGEGVAQVVYRVLGTRDPDVIAWVIRENNIKSDRRGNPLIQPDQQLRLPKDGSTGQAASAAGRR